MKKVLFPENFTWGTATAAYQIEGGFDVDGKGLSIWDDFSHKKGKIKNGDTGDIACDHYHKFEEDTKLMKSLGYPNYRYSISWTRILPEGKGRINQKGIDFYNKLTDSLLEKKITPFVTLYHWDLPLALHKEGGWYNRETAYRFAEYTDIVTRVLGDRVKNWITLNEPWIVMVTGYVLGVLAPGYRRPFSSMKVAHNLLLAHGLAMPVIRKNVKNSNAGITNAFSPVHSYRMDKDLKARKRADAIMNRLWIDPIIKGKYPEEIQKSVESHNKKTNLSEDLKIISAPTDFMGVNNYSRTIVKGVWLPLYNFLPVTPNYQGVKFTSMGWEIYPNGLYEILKMLQNEYGNPPVYITENGVAFYEPKEPKTIQDDNRIQFLKDYLFQVHRAIIKGANVKGYFVWSFMDNFEWAEGYEKTFGLVYVDKNDPNLKRYPKKSASWYSKVIKDNGFEY